MNMNMYVPVCVTHARTHTYTHPCTQQFHSTRYSRYDSLLDPYNYMRTLSCT